MWLNSPLVLLALAGTTSAAIAATCDWATVEVAASLFGDEVAPYATLVQWCSWFLWFTLNRAFSNCLEAALTMAAVLLLVPARGRKAHDRLPPALGFVLAGLSFAVRPSGLPMWLALGLLLLVEHGPLVALPAAAAGGGALAATWGVDYVFYGRFVIPQWSFVKFNLLDGMSGFANAVSPSFHWYFTQGLPAMMATYLPLLAVGAVATLGLAWTPRHALPAFAVAAAQAGMRDRSGPGAGSTRSAAVWLVAPAAAALAGLSLAAQKEFRSALPAMQLLMPLVAVGLMGLSRTQKEVHGARVAAALLALQMPLALFFSQFHLRGGPAVASYIAARARDGTIDSVHFLMPCHATPFYSHVHHQLPMMFLDCSPPGFRPPVTHKCIQMAPAKMTPVTVLRVGSRLQWKPAADPPRLHDEVLAHPQWWLRGLKVFKGLPSHIVMYDTTEAQVGEGVLHELGMQRCASFFHAVLPTDHGPTKRINVWGTRCEPEAAAPSRMETVDAYNMVQDALQAQGDSTRAQESNDAPSAAAEGEGGAGQQAGEL
ncbi:unnamed protein product [Pedinophyceae sp. YPF-701]|nr:unnamed protein product [Pedinophyceae sp. YPF-701]